MRLALAAVSVALVALSGCAPIQDTYKPLYQATPEKHPIEQKK